MANNDYLDRLSIPLAIHEIDFCVKQVNAQGMALILPYKTARTDMERLDSVVGRSYWQREHNIKNGLLFCRLGIWNKNLRQWVWVEDVGTESTIEKDKSKASDSLKRAGVNFGIGRELYSYPKIILQLYPEEYDLVNSEQGYYGSGRSLARPSLFLQQNLPYWKWASDFEDNRLVGLSAHDQENRPRFGYGTLNVKPVVIEIPKPEPMLVQKATNQPVVTTGNNSSGDTPHNAQAPNGAAYSNAADACNHCSHCNHTNFGNSDNQVTTGNGQATRKPWYDTFEIDRPNIEQAILSGQKTPEEILSSLEAIGRVNVKDRKAIFAIAKQINSA